MAKNLTEGQVVEIFYDVMFETNKQADATLIRKIADAGDKEQWFVELTGGVQIQKWIKK